MTEKSKEIGLDVARRRVGRLMRQNGISVVRARNLKWSRKTGQRTQVYPTITTGYTNDQETQWACHGLMPLL